MPVSLAEVVPALLEEFTQKLLEVLRAGAVAELGALKFDGGLPASAEHAPAKAPPRETPSSAAKRRAQTSVRPPAAPPGRRSSRQRKPSLDAIAALLREKPGIGSEEIQRTLGSARSEIRLPMARGLSMGVLRKTGEKRATKYFAADETSSADAPKKPSKARR